VSILLSVYNEETVIRERIKNISEQEFDFSLLELLVGSDASTDETKKFLAELKNEYSWLKVYSFSERRGKALVLNDLVEKSKNDILVFTDANSLFQKDSLKRLIEKFSDNSIGGISGRLILVERDNEDTGSNEERRYWEYETKIKKAEGRCGTLIGANGGIFAIRKNLYKNFPLDTPLTDDLFITISILKMGKKFCYAEDAIAYEDVAPTIRDEFNRKVRFSATNFKTLKYIGFLLKGSGLIANFCYLSHKVLRWFIPFVLVLLPLLNIILFSNSDFFKVILIIQIIFLLLTLIGFLFSKLKIRIIIFSVPFFFLLTNFAIILGFINFLRGRESGIWKPTARDKF
jgi:cellulose synthase/poly-beta-1,6-N-acetylglucosamine synthase-like glycosyltransferase